MSKPNNQERELQLFMKELERVNSEMGEFNSRMRLEMAERRDAIRRLDNEFSFYLVSWGCVLAALLLIIFLIWTN